MSKTWFVTGAGRGIGKEIVQAALSNGDRVVATGRDRNQVAAQFHRAPDRLLPLSLDVTLPAQAESAVEQAVDAFGGIDFVVNNAGYGQLGHFETVTPEAIDKQFTTNVVGVMNVLRAVLPAMRARRSGQVVNMSSIGGALGFEGAAVYCATKFAVEGLSESLALELERFNIGVTIVEPGFFRTDFLDAASVRYGNIDLPDYRDAAAAQKEQFSAYNHAQPGDPKRLGRLIVEASRMPAWPLRLIAGSDALALTRERLQRRSQEAEAGADRSSTTRLSQRLNALAQRRCKLCRTKPPSSVVLCRDARRLSAPRLDTGTPIYMSKQHPYTTSITWTGNRGQGTVAYRGYDRVWEVRTPGKPVVLCSNDPLLGGDPAKPNPEDLLLSALAACHMLWYLHLCREAGLVVTGYQDVPVAVGETSANGAGRFLHATLRPTISLGPGSDPADADAIHARVHQYCFIARSLNFPVRCEAKYIAE